MKLRVYIDPGKNGCGVSVFVEKSLLAARYVKSIGGAIHPLFEVVGEVEKYLACVLADEDFDVVIELPQVYEAAHQKGDQQDLINLAVVVGGLARGINRPVSFVLPRDWKGQVPKEITQQRAKEVLDDSEFEAVVLPAASLAHNVWDAVAMGLHFAGRIK